MDSANEQLYRDLSKHFNGVSFRGSYNLEDSAWYINATGVATKPYRISDNDAREKSYDEILQEAIAHFTPDGEE